jgi:hypothetical protein
MNGTEQSAAFGGAPWEKQMGRFSVACTMVITHIYVGCTIKKHKKGDLDVLIQHNQWESTVSCYVHTHICIIYIYILTHPILCAFNDLLLQYSCMFALKITGLVIHIYPRRLCYMHVLYVYGIHLQLKGKR